MNTVFRGIWSSVMATSSMTLSMFQLQDSVPQENRPLPPAEITHSLQKKLGLNPPGPSELQQEATLFSHYGYGAAAGIAYAALAPRFTGNSLAKGALFGAAVWAGSYYGLLPGMDVRASGPKMSTNRNLMMLASHLVWGASLGFAEEKLRQESRSLLDGRRYLIH